MRPLYSGAFKMRTVLIMVLVGFAAFLAMMYFIGIGDTGNDGRNGDAHAASDGLNGYSGLARLMELEGRNVVLSRSPGNLDTYDLLILTPPMYSDPEEFGELLEQRKFRGPTLVILPKWWARRFPDRLPAEVRDQVEDGWVQLFSTQSLEWVEELPLPYTLKIEDALTKKPARWSGLGLGGVLPEGRGVAASSQPDQDTLVTHANGRALVVNVTGAEGSEFYEEAQELIFIIEPDLVNNYGLADSKRAALAYELVDMAAYGDEDTRIVFDLTLNGFAGTANLLTLAFRPPFLAATLCLIAALLVVGWRAFRRFGPALADEPVAAFGKSRLVANGAGLILRAKRLQLLAEPYIALSARRIAQRLGLVRSDITAIDAALERRLPDEPGFAARAANLRTAKRQSDIIRAAQALKDLEEKLTP